MKNPKNRILTALAMVTVGAAFTACSIDLLPLNDVTYDNYWTNKDEVESVVTACYGSMHDTQVIQRMIAWGESRSDNTRTGDPIDANLNFLMRGSLRTTNTICDWSPFYKAINYCNVLQLEAPKVKAKDPNYTESDYNTNIAETSFIRAYLYLTLIKTFRDVPFTLDAFMDDTQSFRLPQTKFEDILDALIADIELRKDLAPRRYTDQALNTGRVTRAAMYSLLAELYLWRASDYNLSKAQQNEYYGKCIECCDKVLAFKAQQYDENNIDGLDLRTVIDQEVYREYNYPLLAEETTVGVNNGGPAAYNSIFGEGAAFETIFELAFNYRSTHETNTAVNRMYGANTREQWMKASEKVMESAPSAQKYDLGSTLLFHVTSDYRCLTSFYFDKNGGASYIYKYVNAPSGAGSDNAYGRVGLAFTAPTSRASVERGSSTPNWILYRMTEIMLFRAEAEIEMANNLTNIDDEPANDETDNDENGDNDNQDGGDNDNVSDGDGDNTNGDGPEVARRKVTAVVNGADFLGDPEALLNDAYILISAVYRRSNPAVKMNSALAPSMPQTYDEFHNLLMMERRREFLFEGKRYFDLVRSARRQGNTRELREALTTKYSTAGQAVILKMYQMGFMYMPVYRDEIKRNPNLQQNECYLDELENTKN